MPQLPQRITNLPLQLRVDNWQNYVPIIPVLRSYRRGDLGHDLVAGVVLGVITVPQAIAYAFLAGLPAAAGLYASLAPMVLYALLGSSRHLVVGPVAITAVMVAAAVGQYAPRYEVSYLGISAVLCLQAGVMLWLLRLFQMGGLVNLLSHPVITGFVNAAALLIVMSQLPALTGIGGGQATDPVHQLIGQISRIGDLNVTTLGIGIASLAGLWLVERYAVATARRVFPNLGNEHPLARCGPMLVTVLAVSAVGLWNLDTTSGVAVVGHLPSGLPELTRPPFRWAMWLDIAPASAMIALVSYVESYSIGATLATRERTRVNSHQELIALGAANVGAAFTGGYPVAASFSRSSVNHQSGARTQVSGLICVAVVILTLLFFTPFFERLPQAALAAIIMLSVVGIVDVASLRRHWRVHREDSITEFATLLTVLVFGVEAGLLTGVALSIAFFVRTSSRPHIAVVGRVPNTEAFRSARRHDVETFPHVAAIRVDENIYFANTNQVESKLLKIVQRRPGTQHVLLVCSAVNMIDVTGLEMLYRLNQTFDAMGIKLHLSEVKGPVMEQLEATDLIARLTGSVFFTTDQAMRDLAQRY